MESSNLTIVCYAGGMCGDLVSALVDHRGSRFTSYKTINHVAERIRLKKPHLLTLDEKNQYLSDISKQYLSIPSHDLEYHRQQSHNFISITVEDFKTATWAASRFKNIHRPHVWQEMQQLCGATDIESYAQILIDFSNLVKQTATATVSLEDIISGRVISSLETILKSDITQPSKNIYNNWLDLQNNTYII
jgi:hypothetical protein